CRRPAAAGAHSFERPARPSRRPAFTWLCPNPDEPKIGLIRPRPSVPPAGVDNSLLRRQIRDTQPRERARTSIGQRQWHAVRKKDSPADDWPRGWLIGGAAI